MTDLNMIKKLHALFMECSGGVTTDSRNVSADSLFVALKGENFDGNKFADQALEQGAKYALVSSGTPSDRKFFVEDTLEALQTLAMYHRSRFDIPVIALTGTNGKTTTKELVTAVLSSTFRVTATQGNLNNHIGVPLTLLRINSETQVAVVEMGANHPGEIALLANIALPNAGLVTNVGSAHLEGFGSFDGVKRAKGELYDYLQRTADFVFYNADDTIITSMVEARPDLKRIPYGVSYSGAEVIPAQSRNPYLRLKLNDSYILESHLVGNYNADNVMAALAVGEYMKVTPEAARKAVESYIPSNHRSQLYSTQDNMLILDTYNANPSSMKASLDNFRKSAFESKGVILGDMRELGTESAAEHLKVLEFLRNSFGDSLSPVILVGSEFSKYERDFSGFSFFTDVDVLITYLENNRIKGKTLLLKGSHGINLPKAINSL